MLCKHILQFYIDIRLGVFYLLDYIALEEIFQVWDQEKWKSFIYVLWSIASISNFTK